MTAEPAPSPLYVSFTRHSASRSSLVIAFLWGLAEATLFFIVPDMYLGFVAVFHWRRGLLATLATVAGAMIGGATMYVLAVSNGAAVNQLLVRIPLISPEMVRTVAEQMRASGLAAMISAPLQAVPYKIYAAQAGQQHFPFIQFLLVTLPARLERTLPVVLAAAAFGSALKRLVQRRTALVIGTYALLWVGVYVAYYLQMR